jgi:hypothetical protein
MQINEAKLLEAINDSDEEVGAVEVQEVEAHEGSEVHFYARVTCSIEGAFHTVGVEFYIDGGDSGDEIDVCQIIFID